MIIQFIESKFVKLKIKPPIKNNIGLQFLMECGILKITVFFNIKTI